VGDPRRRGTAGARRAVPAPGPRHPVSRGASRVAPRATPVGGRADGYGSRATRTRMARVLGDDGGAPGAPLPRAPRADRRLRDARRPTGGGNRDPARGHHSARRRRRGLRPTGPRPVRPRGRGPARGVVPRIRERNRRSRADRGATRALVRAERAGASPGSAGRVVDRLPHRGRDRRSPRRRRRLRHGDPPDHRRTGVRTGQTPCCSCSTVTCRVRPPMVRSKISATTAPTAMPSTTKISAVKPKTCICEYTTCV